jgi:hypothetical protein
MVSYSFVFFTVLALTLLSASSAAAIALMVDTRTRPSAALVVRRLMQVALLGASAMVALLGVA